MLCTASTETCMIHDGKTNKLKQATLYTLQCFTAIFIAMEIAIPPNPYRVHLILCLTALICIKHDIPSKVINTLEKLWNSLK